MHLIFSADNAADNSFCIHLSSTVCHTEQLVAMVMKLLYLLATFLLAETAMVISYL